MRKAPVLLLAAVVLGTLPGNVVAQETEIQEWVVPWEQSRPRDPHAADHADHCSGQGGWCRPGVKSKIAPGSAECQG